MLESCPHDTERDHEADLREEQFLVLQAGFFGFLDFHIYCFLWFFTDAKVGIPFQGCKQFRKNLLADA